MKHLLMHTSQVLGSTTVASFRLLTSLSITLLLLAMLLPAPVANAQTLQGVGAAMDIQEDIGGNRGRNRRPAATEEDDVWDQEAESTTEDLEAEEASAEEAPVAKSKPSKIDSWNDEHSIVRAPFALVHWAKILPVALLFLCWIRSCDWISRDAQLFGLGYEHWNLIAVLPFVVAFIVLMLVPLYPLGVALLFLTWIVPFVMFSLKHNASVEPHEKVFTGDWFNFQMALAGKKFGLKIGGEKQPGYMEGPAVDLIAKGGDERTNNANLLTARQSPAYVLVKELVADMVARNSERVLLDYSQEVVGVRHLMDGVWHNAEPKDRESGDVLLAVMKQLANLDASERRKKQEGEFAAEFNKHKYQCPIQSQGTKAGERVIVSLRGGHEQDFMTFNDIGMRDKLREQWSEVMGLDSGVVVYSAPPEGGLTTLTDVGLLETDRLMRDFFTIEEVSHPERDIENIEAVFYDASKEETPASMIRKISLRYPNVYVCRDWINPEGATKLLEEVQNENRMWVTTVHSKEAPEALLRILQKKVPHKEFAESVIAVLNTRLIRTLCKTCRVAYPASPDLLKKLGIPAGKVTELFRPPKEDEIEKPCPTCSGIGYRGRTGLFELLIVTDEVREVLLKQPKMDLLRKAARAAGMRTIQEEGILLVAKGETSLPELSRVLKS